MIVSDGSSVGRHHQYRSWSQRTQTRESRMALVMHSAVVGSAALGIILLRQNRRFSCLRVEQFGVVATLASAVLPSYLPRMFA
ncbi:MAG: hypothetical protein IPM83_16930 [Ignavibacteria bacterium]|nr:hypothetical protein [Ignavibacteria bacterium]